jgi:two-component system NtrC family sensor kinase
MKRTTLIVDDSLTVRMDLADAFTEAGFATVLCATATEARRALAGEPVSLVVLDVVLPDGDGVEILQEIRSSPATAKTPVLLLSTEAEVKDRIRGLRTGADEYVGKPYDRGYVVGRARELVRDSEPAVRTVQKATILVVDDSATFREGLREALEAGGYSVLTAPSGEEGLRILAGARPTAVIVDGIMPGIDGSTMIRTIRLDAALRGLPCLLLTALDEHGAELRALDAGADAFVRKDEDLEVILARLAAVLRSSGGQSDEGKTLFGPRRVLAVDDSSTYLNELSPILRGEGYDVICARSGDEAIEMLAVQQVDCILLDLNMPGLSGTETCRRIKNAPVVRDIPLIMLTAFEGPAAMIDGLSTGADDFITKSSDFDVLKARVRAQLRRKQFEDEHRKVREDLLKSELRAAEERSARRLAEAKASLVEEVQRKNKELEAFSYSVSHDLRAPLRSIDGFSQALLEDCADQLDEKGKGYLQRVCAAAKRMDELIDDLLELSRVSRAELNRTKVDLGAVAKVVAEELARKEPERQVTFAIEDELLVEADSRLMRVLFDNLLGNAWKFTSKTAETRIEVSRQRENGDFVYFVRDNGAGFDMAHAAKLFSPFQRLHSQSDFQGTGIGLATVHRIVDRHGGRVWAEGQVGKGATLFFSIPSKQSRMHP